MSEKEDPALLVPHRGRMLLLSRINEYNTEERTLCAESFITEDCLFYDPIAGGVPAYVGFEFAAQAIAALSGLRSREKGENPRIGFILSVSSMRISLPFFRLGSTVVTRVKEIGRMDQVYSFEVEVFLEGRKVLGGKLTVADPTDEQIESLTKEKYSRG